MTEEMNFLEGEEHDVCIEDISVIVTDTINRLIANADKHNVDRDNAVQHFAQLFGAMAEISTFKNWKVRNYLKVGSYTPPNEDGNGEVIDREWYRQGYIFKDEEAFRNRPDDPCYIPELSDSVYTRNDIVGECGGNEELAEEVFETLDWQHVSSLLDDWQANGEIDTCKNCGKLFNCYGETKCPYCGAKYEGSDEK